jgi:ABC-2 type transport system ATP-binding protein
MAEPLLHHSVVTNRRSPLPAQRVHDKSQNFPRLDVKQVFYSFGKRPVLRGIDLSVQPGEIYGLLGPNGAGKTTLMTAICGRIRLASGAISVDGQNIAASQKASRAVSFVPQNISIYPHLTVEENLQVFGRFAGVPGPMIGSAVKNVLARAGLAEQARRLCRTLSGGYQRRVNICASLLQNPSVLLLDEPTVGIDIDAREAIHALLHSLSHAGTALVIATHDLDQAQILCNRVGIMQEGRICLEGEPAALLQRTFGFDKSVIVNLRSAPPEHGHNTLYDLGFRPTQSPLTWFGFARAGTLDVGALGRHLASSGLVLKEILIREPDLASLFMHVLGLNEAP